MNPVLVFEAASKAHAGRTVLPPTHLALAPGELLAVTGPSGAGKSTLLRLAAGLIAPDSGRVTVRAASVGFVFQEPRLLPWLRALDNAALPLLALGVPRRQSRHRAALLLDALGLGGFHAVFPARLSGGMRQRVSLARALVLEPKLLLLDEPYTGLDQALKLDVRGLVERQLADTNAAAVLVTHDSGDIPQRPHQTLRLGADQGDVSDAWRSGACRLEWPRNAS